MVMGHFPLGVGTYRKFGAEVKNLEDTGESGMTLGWPGGPVVEIWTRAQEQLITMMV